ncbi:MAG: hypothetical protein ACTSRU_19380, partial [Candidatus Hodarchaeales archaeon]
MSLEHRVVLDKANMFRGLKFLRVTGNNIYESVRVRISCGEIKKRATLFNLASVSKYKGPISTESHGSYKVWLL